jgi:putative transposase
MKKQEILDFFVGWTENHLRWQEILQQLYERAVKKMFLGVFDGLLGLEEALQECIRKSRMCG